MEICSSLNFPFDGSGIAGASMAPRQEDTAAGSTLSHDILYEIMKRLDAVTLATASCVCLDFRAVCTDETLWESLCSARWPSTRNSEVKAVISSVGGFRKFCSQCYPLIVNKEPELRREEEFGPELQGEDWWDEEYDGVEPNPFSPSDLVSIVDVVFDQKPVLSRIIQGIPGAADIQGWFGNCAFRVEALRYREQEGGRPENQVLISGGLPPIVSVSRERREGKFWKVLWDKLRVSWIVANKKTKQMANFASWGPVGGLRHWPFSDEFIIRFGCILPSKRDAAFRAVQCNIELKCSFSNTYAGQGAVETSLGLTELSMQLENMNGPHLNGSESMAILREALSCGRSTHQSEVLDSYHHFVQVQFELKEEKVRYEGRLDTAAALSALAAIVCVLYVFV